MYLWPDAPYINQYANPMFFGLTGILTVLFTYSYFRENPRQSRIVNAGLALTLAFNLVILICGAAGLYLLSNKLGAVTMFGGILAIGWCLSHHLWTGYRPARFFAVAFSLLGIGGIMNAMRLLGWLPANFFTMIYGMQIFSGAQIVLLSFALADRYRMLERERETLAAVSEAKSAFLANMSHEIRTPLNAILGAGELLAESAAGAGQRRYIEMLQRAGGNLLNLVNDVLDLAKIQSGRVQFENVDFDPQNLVHECARLLRPEANKKGLQLDESFGADLPRSLSGDPTRLSRILINLTHNAIKFTETGSVQLRLERQSGTDRYRFSVADTGIGIAPDHLDRIFDSFTQADESITRRYGGTGLGLTIVREIVEAMGGTIEVQSNPGSGSVFSATVPLRAGGARQRDDRGSIGQGDPTPPTDARRASERSASVSYRALEILLAEDNPDNRTLVQAFLRDRPYRIDVAENGAEAVELFRDRRYDVILMDIQMPVMDGLAAVQAIRAQEKSRASRLDASGSIQRTPIYALTAHALQEEIEKNLEAGCDGHISKPVRRQVLLDLLDSL
jgi:signal transduction histidine kinase